MGGPRVDIYQKDKICGWCGQKKLITDFYSDGKGGWQSHCKACVCERAVSDRRKREFGISSAQVDHMIEEQNGRCLICGTEKPLHVDHDHVTGRIRGMLCLQCNSFLGNAKDSIEILERAIAYLRLFSGS